MTKLSQDSITVHNVDLNNCFTEVQSYAACIARSIVGLIEADDNRNASQ